MKYLFIVGFVLMAAAQWYVPGSMIFKSERTAVAGVEYKFRTFPIDPSDPFRGKYVTLSFVAEDYSPEDTTELNFRTDQSVYASVGLDTAGFAKIIKLSAEPPEDNVDYFTAIFEYGQYSRLMDFPDSTFKARPYIKLHFPFQRFYVEESKASEIEQQYWEAQGDSSTTCYAVVKVRDGSSSLIDVKMNDRSFTDIIREINEAQE